MKTNPKKILDSREEKVAWAQRLITLLIGFTNHGLVKTSVDTFQTTSATSFHDGNAGPPTAVNMEAVKSHAECTLCLLDRICNL